jgi:chromosome segregation ATPase
MIEPIMYIGIGFLVASLLVIGVIPLVHARAVRLTAKRLEALTPMSMAEIQAEKDQLRAEFAMTTRRLEMNVEQMKAKTTNQLAEIGKKSEAVGRLKIELGEKSAAMFALEAKENQLAEDLRQIQKDLAARTAALQQAEQSLAGARAKIGELTSNVNDIALTGDEQRVELIALRAQVEVLKGQAETLENEVQELTERLSMKTSEAEGYNRQLVDERGRSDAFSNRIGELERQLVAQTTEAEILERRVHELNARADEQGRLLAERDYATHRLHDEAAQNEAAVRTEFAEADSRSWAASEILRTEKILLESQLRQAQEERAQLLYDLETIRREVELGESAAMFALEAKEKQLAEDLRQTQKDLAARTAALQQAEQSLAGARAKIGPRSASSPPT